MRFRLSIALLVSVVLIGGALFYKLSASHGEAQISFVQGDENNLADVSISLDGDTVTDLSVPTSSTSTDNLSTTDLIGRSLLSDYINLAANGEDTEDNVNALANKYADQVPTLTISQELKASDVQTVDDTQSNYQKYADAFTKIHKTYVDYINKTGIQKKNITDLGPDLYFAARAFSIAYTQAGDSLKSLPVPLSLASLHLQLVNSYYSSGAAMLAISKTENDSASAFAGLVTLSSNLKIEDSLMAEITKTINSHGV
ncbi:hypothetical protein KW790_01340 [Candidatus Parcubacteria bacterium]|nr:hypothetical protein [Candidatus Parcubacteria bacterium]